MNEEKIITFIRSERGKATMAVSFMLVLALHAVFSSKNTIQVLQSKGEVTSGAVTEEAIVGNHSYIYYKYQVDNKTYKANSRYVEGVKIPGGKYIVVYNPDDPLMHTILYSREIKEDFGGSINYDVSNEEIRQAVWQQF